MPSVITESFQETQKQFTQNIRQLRANIQPIDNVQPGRMKLYKELVYNNIESITRKTFPVMTKILNQTTWHALIGKFIEQYAFDSPYFSDISKSFVMYLNNLQQEELYYPFLAELAHYEWVELEIALYKEHKQMDLIQQQVVLNNELLECQLAPKETARLLTYAYPVHQISPDFLPLEKPDTPTFLVVYRNKSFEVKFMTLNGLTACLLEILSEHPTTLVKATHQLCDALKFEFSPNMLSKAKELCSSLIHKDILMLR